MFLAVGPPAFTANAVLKLANDAQQTSSYFKLHESSVEMIRVIALFFALFYWVYAFWFSCVGIIATLCTVRQMSFKVTWYSAVFPNVALTIATITIGTALNSPPLLWLASGITGLLTAVWLLIFGFHLRAIWLGFVNLDEKA